VNGSCKKGGRRNLDQIDLRDTRNERSGVEAAICQQTAGANARSPGRPVARNFTMRIKVNYGNHLIHIAKPWRRRAEWAESHLCLRVPAAACIVSDAWILGRVII
jgi:hypothetical protein